MLQTLSLDNRPLQEELKDLQQTLELAEQRAQLFRELEEMVRAEEELQRALEESPEKATQLAEQFDGGGGFSGTDLGTIRQAFAKQFGRPLPVSANGATALHRSLGFDHRGRVDVALHPDHKDGKWLRKFLEKMGIPYIAYRRRVPGKSTGAHIHIGTKSPRIRSQSD